MNKNAKTLVVINTITLIIMLFANFASNTGVFSKQAVGDVSHKYDTLFAPASYAFAIWGFLFLLAIAFVIFQWVLLKNNDPKKFIQRTGIWFSLGNIANAFWIYFWINEMIGWSVLLIFLLLISLIILTIHLRLELDDEPVRIIFFVWWPITFYLGWIMVATVACVAAWLVSIGWSAAGLQQDTWTIIMIAVASLIYIFLLIKRNMREALVVGVWAFIAIAIRQWNLHFNVAIAAIIAASILAVASFIHVYKNHYYAPGPKLKRNEWK
jgi:hypothetical protein